MGLGDMMNGCCRYAVMSCLVCSVALNVYMVMIMRMNMCNGVSGLSWSERAAAEAEAAAAVYCSGHGRAYLDGGGCECHDCYGGPTCSLFLGHACVANANGGDPLFLEPFWMKHAANSAILVAGWHRMSYSYDDQTFVSKELENHIRKLHSLIGNAVTDGRFIVFGTGSTQLLGAAVNSLFPHNSSAPANVVASIPYYTLYRMQTEMFDSVNNKFEGDTAAWAGNNSGSTEKFIEFVTAPNNPDGQMNEAVLSGPNVKAIHDRAYYWPHFTAIPSPANEDLTIFTISKLTGHAGSRFGWALIKDEEVYKRMTMYMTLNSMGVSRDTQLRTLKLIKVVLDGGGKEIFEFGYGTMSKRWKRLRDVVSLSDRFSLQQIPSQYCTYFNKPRDPTPAYAWLKCEREEGRSCYEVLRAGNITGREGSAFKAEDRYVRLSLIRSEDDFDVLVKHLEKLASEEVATQESGQLAAF